jgi:D-sedoheptulose 7-phosphate isomerase
MDNLARKYKKTDSKILKIVPQKQTHYGLEKYYNESASKRDFAKGYFDYLSELMERVDVKVVEQIIDAFSEALEKDKVIYFLGNGGSAVTASHFANDIGIGTRGSRFHPFKVLSLTDNLAVLTAVSNDDSFDNVFVRQLEPILQKRDVVVALSVSGNSPNVLKAVRYAKTIGAKTVGCTGFDGGSLRKIADISFHISTPKGEYGPVEDLFMILDHIIYSYFKLERFGRL